MALIDKVPGDLKLYLGGMFTLRRRDAIQEANITHVLSVLRLPLDEQLFTPFKHMVVEVDDVDDENLLEHFPATNKFIQEGLDGGGGVLVHCAMGKSRSAACVIAYLMQKQNISAADALEHVRLGRSIAEPNDGFMQQLEMYGEMTTPDNVEDTPAYQRWMYQREIAQSRECNLAPEVDIIRFEDEHKSDATVDFEMKCRKCRRSLATSQYVLPHESPSAEELRREYPPRPAQACAHYYVDPLSWMRPELEQGILEGRLECPGCKSNVGKYAWQGSRCNCGTWVVPGISMTKARIDEVRKAKPAFRRPPGSVAPPTQGSL